MRKFLVRRLTYLVFTWFVFATLLFVIFRIAPGDPTTMYIPDGMTAAERQATLERYGLTKPLHEQYFHYMANLLQGDLGMSYRYNAPVLDILATKFWNTIFLMGTGFAISYCLGTLFGAYLGWVRGTVKEKLGLIMALIQRSSPEFWIGIILLNIFVFQLGWFPWGGISAIGSDAPAGFFTRYFNWDFAYHVALPVATAVIYYSAQPILVMRNNMIGVMNSDFVEIKEAEGLPTYRVLYHHAARNSILPMITLMATVTGLSVGGSLVIETVFSWPGMGLEMVESVTYNDYPMAMGTFLLMGSVVIVMNFLADIAYTYLDPRVRYD